jgi:hypothetical protein
MPPKRAQRLIDQQVRSDWPVLLNDIARSLNRTHHGHRTDCSTQCIHARTRQMAA